MTKSYITTAIPYVNGDPHIGHAMDYLLADTFYRYKTMLGEEVRFQAGTDEHGNKIFQKAGELGVPVEEYVNKNSKKFQDFIDALGARPTDFIRTTSTEHEKRCQEIWKRLSNHIYPSKYEGWYCSGCEGFFTQKEYDQNGGVCPDHQKSYEKLSEENYYFRVSDFKDRIREAIEKDEMKILPDFRKKEVLKLLEDAPDVSVSRPKSQLAWGIQVPTDENQVMYVWIDALANYITVLGYPDKDISEFWPATVQFVGKDILRFHAIIWPAMLLGLGLPLPKTLCSHGHILSNGQKMSKSLGNVVDPLKVLEKHGRDAFRYFFLRHIDTFEDSDFTWEKYEAAYNNELANDLGNLVQRLSTLCMKNSLEFTPKDNQFSPSYTEAMNEFDFNSAFDHAWIHIQNLNREINEKKPWELVKEGRVEEAKTILMDIVNKLLHATNELRPFLPDTSEKIFEIFSKSPIIPPETPLFPKD